MLATASALTTPNDPPAPESSVRLRTVPAPALTYAEALAEGDRLVEYYARRHVCPGAELDDLVQEARLGLLRAADEWRRDGGASFGTFATFWIKSYLGVARRLARRRGMTIGRGNRKEHERATPIEAMGTLSLDVDEDDAPPAVFAAAAQETALAEAQELALVTGAIDALPERDRAILMMWAVEGLTYVEIAKRIGVTAADASKRNKNVRASDMLSTSAISRRARAALEELSALLKARGFAGTLRIDGRRPYRRAA